MPRRAIRHERDGRRRRSVTHRVPGAPRAKDGADASHGDDGTVPCAAGPQPCRTRPATTSVAVEVVIRAAPETRKPRCSAVFEALCRTRTGDPFLTMEAMYKSETVGLQGVPVDHILGGRDAQFAGLVGGPVFRWCSMDAVAGHPRSLSPAFGASTSAGSSPGQRTRVATPAPSNVRGWRERTHGAMRELHPASFPRRRAESAQTTDAWEPDASGIGQVVEQTELAPGRGRTWWEDACPVAAAQRSTTALSE